MIHPFDLPIWLAMALEITALSALMGGLSLARHRFNLAPETSRKLFHIGGGLTTLSFPWLFRSTWPILILALLTLGSLLALKYSHIFKENLGAVLYRVKRKSFGEIYFPLSVSLLFLFAMDHVLLFVIPVLILTLADPAAALIGQRLGRKRYRIVKGQKSIEGSLAFLLVAFLCALGPLLLLGSAGWLEAILISLLVGLLATFVEALAWEGLDNLLVPLVSAMLLLVLLTWPLWALISAVVAGGILGLALIVLAISQAESRHVSPAVLAGQSGTKELPSC